ncbi:ester cyclase [Pseudomonas sp. H3(2019)]|uniref:ester cyclase n=1 Tax=Pseudomonas sp. H3(2019) TaxID=2598724 RepID=UPI001193E94D|nr:ester cyclase [Pseudomonas sp. H3(2019)]TVT84331.1 ester cyclase [Pseudomonas sp. H3(2019)]
MSLFPVARPTHARCWLLSSLVAVAVSPVFAATDPLVQPRTVIVDHSLAKAQVEEQILAARRYGTFWTTGDEALARAALIPDFKDSTLPPGRPQGITGPIAASKTMHAAIPDIQCEVEQMMVVGDRVIAHLRFTGHFTGQFKGVQGKGQTIDFIATDIYRVVEGRIAENWHLEDNLTLLQQLGMVK